jgi:hypothetical protein
MGQFIGGSNQLGFDGVEHLQQGRLLVARVQVEEVG